MGLAKLEPADCVSLAGDGAGQARTGRLCVADSDRRGQTRLRHSLAVVRNRSVAGADLSRPALRSNAPLCAAMILDLSSLQGDKSKITIPRGRLLKSWR